MNYKRDLVRIEHITGKAKAAAWGPKLVPIAGQRKVSETVGSLWTIVQGERTS